MLKRVAIIDDEAEGRNFIAKLLEGHGYTCSGFANGRDAISALGRDTFDLIIVDWNMPGITGIDVIEWVRSNVTHYVPIIMMTSRSEETDIVKGLEAGADDFIVKPERASIITARAAAVIRRNSSDTQSVRVESFGRYSFDTAVSEARVDGELVEMTSKEFTLALSFFRNLQRPLSRAYLLETVWKSVGDLPTRTLDVHVSRIRSKLGLRPENGYSLQTVFGFGYRLEEIVDEE
jgi:DNA-binding response OmpR family regulator